MIEWIEDKRSRDSQYAGLRLLAGVTVTPAGKIHVLHFHGYLFYSFLNLGDMIHRIFKINTYIMSNVAPQYLDFQLTMVGGIWDVKYTQKKQDIFKEKYRTVLFDLWTGVDRRTTVKKCTFKSITMPKPAT